MPRPPKSPIEVQLEITYRVTSTRKMKKIVVVDFDDNKYKQNAKEEFENSDATEDIRFDPNHEQIGDDVIEYLECEPV